MTMEFHEYTIALFPVFVSVARLIVAGNDNDDFFHSHVTI